MDIEIYQFLNLKKYIPCIWYLDILEDKIKTNLIDTNRICNVSECAKIEVQRGKKRIF